MPTLASELSPREADIRELVEAHKELEDTPLLLAFYYMPEGDSENLYLLEVLDGFGGNEIDTDETLFEFSYGPASGFPLQENQRLYMTLTNPQELAAAFDNQWPAAQTIQNAAHQGRGMVIYQDPIKGGELASLLLR